MTSIICDVCPRECSITAGRVGFCGIRGNIDGENVDTTRNLLLLDPPYTRKVLSGGYPRYVAWFPGCNMRCWFCVYPDNTQTEIPDPKNLEHLSPTEFIDEAHAWAISEVMFFGGEPTIHHEYVIEACQVARESGLGTWLETNGYIVPWLAQRIAAAVDHPIIGVKGSASPNLYATMNAHAGVCLESAAIMYHTNPKMWIVNLVDPCLRATVKDDCRFGDYIRRNLSPDVRVLVNHLLMGRPIGTWGHPSLVARLSLDKTWSYSSQVASRLVDCGLSNVWIEDPRSGYVHVSVSGVDCGHYPKP